MDSDADAGDALAPGARVDRYVIEARVGDGATAVVYRARDGARPVALKVLRASWRDDPVQRARLAREASLLEGWSHPHRVSVLGHGALDDGRPYVAMEYVDAPTLRDVLRTHGRLAPDATWRIARAVASALAAAHARGVIHRDVKPENVLVPEVDGVPSPRLTDFGIARDAHGDVGALTGEGAPLGTAGYMPPEQWWNDGITPAADQYALGVLCVECMAGRLPFASARYAELMQHHLTAAPPSLRALGVDATDAMESWVARALAKSPDARFASMESLLDAGDAAFGAAPRSFVTRTIDPRPLGVACVGWCAVVACGYAGDHDPRRWMYLGGWATWAVVAAHLAGLALATTRRGRAWAMWLPLAFGWLGTLTGWFAVRAYLARMPEAVRFTTLNAGLAEAGVARFLGVSSAAIGALAWWSSARDVLHDDVAQRRLSRVVTLGATAMLAVCVAARVGDAALCLAGLVALALSLRGRAVSDAARAGVGAVGLSCVWSAAGAVCAAAARVGDAWATSPDRATRVLRLVDAMRAQSVTAALAVLSVFVGVGVARRAGATWPRGRARLWLGAWALCELALAGRVAYDRAALGERLRARFELLARIDPPSAARGRAPGVAPTVQVSRDRVALDGVPVALTRGLGDERGLRALTADLAHAVARHDARVDAPQLLVMVDRRVLGRDVARVLRAARAVGVERVELLRTRGPSVTIPWSAATEVAWTLPDDFVAVPLRLGADATGSLPDDATYATIVDAVAAEDAAGHVAVRAP